MSLAMSPSPDHTALRGCGLGWSLDVIGVLSFVGLAGLAGGLFAKRTLFKRDERHDTQTPPSDRWGHKAGGRPSSLAAEGHGEQMAGSLRSGRPDSTLIPARGLRRSPLPPNHAWCFTI